MTVIRLTLFLILYSLNENLLKNIKTNLNEYGLLK